jgi:hypothetical protein
MDTNEKHTNEKQMDLDEIFREHSRRWINPGLLLSGHQADEVPRMSGIYAISEFSAPAYLSIGNQIIRYIGKSVDLRSRFRDHANPNREANDDLRSLWKTQKLTGLERHRLTFSWLPVDKADLGWVEALYVDFLDMDPNRSLVNKLLKKRQKSQLPIGGKNGW